MTLHEGANVQRKKKGRHVCRPFLFSLSQNV